MVSVSAQPTSVTPGAYPRERVLPGALARMRREDWGDMTAPMNNSQRHVGCLQRWIDQAQRENPKLDQGQAERLAVELKAEFYRKLSEAGVRARRLRAAGSAGEGAGNA